MNKSGKVSSGGIVGLDNGMRRGESLVSQSYCETVEAFLNSRKRLHVPNNFQDLDSLTPAKASTQFELNFDR